MEGCQQIGVISCEFFELGELVSQHGEDEASIDLGIAGAPGLEPPVLVVLDQAVIRVARKGERVEPERVDRRLREDPQAGTCFLQKGQIVADHVVSEHELRAGGVFVERAQRSREVAVAVGARVGGCRTDRREALNPAGVRIDLKVDRDASRKKLLCPHYLSQVPTVQAVAPDVRMLPGVIRNLAKVYRPKNIRNAVWGAA